MKPEEDFLRFLQDLRTKRREPVWNWKHAASAENLAGNQVADQLARCWTAGAVENPAVSMDDAARAELAARYQLVTPFSGAVVLETQEQYDQYGLTPVDGDATPHIPNAPEPAAGLLVMLWSDYRHMVNKKADPESPDRHVLG